MIKPTDVPPSAFLAGAPLSHRPWWVLLAALLLLPVASVAAERPNVLFIAVDDLRPQLGCYGQDQMHSPNIDRLAGEGVLFERAYCMVPTCGASRASLMTGIRPTPKRFVSYLASAEKEAAGITTLNTHFKNNGYTTLSNGKVFHHPGDNAIGWSEPAWRPRQRFAADSAAGNRRDASGGNRRSGAAARRDEDGNRRGAPYEISPLADDQLGDGQVALKTIEDMQRLQAQGKPFFLAAGFFKPHLPFVAPEKYWDLYPEDSIQLPANYHRPKDAPEMAIHNFGELRAYTGIPKTGPVSDQMALNLIRGYQACVSFTDAQIGRLLDELERLGLAENTIVVLWGDHGWNLGEHTLWCKHSCFEVSMRVPLIIRAPGVKGGTRTAGLTELIDIYPTLCELAGLPVPVHTEGRSFAPLLNDPQLPWKEQAIGRFQAGDTIRTDRYRFTEYSPAQRPPVANMLYDHKNDPQENVNLSGQSAASETVQQLTDRLRAAKGKDDKQQSAVR